MKKTGTWKKISLNLLGALSLNFLVVLATPAYFAWAAENEPTTSGTALKGGVVEIEVTLGDLRDARLSTSRVRKAAANLYDEVTRQEITMGSIPNVVGSTVIMTPIAMPTGQLMAPRKQWVDASMAEIGPIINLFKKDVDKAIEDDQRTEVSERNRKDFDVVKNEIYSLVNTAFQRYNTLGGYTSGTSYDNQAIAQMAKGLDDDMKKLDRSLKKGVSILQKEAKLAKKDR